MLRNLRYAFRREVGRLTIGILSMQGDIEEHEAVLEKIGIDSIRVKKSADLNNIQGLIFPGGESTTMIRLLKISGLIEPLKEKIGISKMPVFGTCAGMILLSRGIENYPEQETLGLIDITVERNAFGRQIDSFAERISVPAVSKGMIEAVFIRAPIIAKVFPGVEVLAEYKGQVVFARQENVIVSSFHPELTQDLSVHTYFLSMVKEWRSSLNSSARCY